MRGKARYMTDGELLFVKPYLEDRLEREYKRVSGWEDDPITVHYGVANEMAGLVYARVHAVEDALDAIEFELEYRAINPWARESEEDRAARRYRHLNPLPQEYFDAVDHWSLTGEHLEGWSEERMEMLRGY